MLIFSMMLNFDNGILQYFILTVYHYLCCDSFTALFVTDNSLLIYLMRMTTQLEIGKWQGKCRQVISYVCFLGLALFSHVLLLNISSRSLSCSGEHLVIKWKFCTD